MAIRFPMLYFTGTAAIPGLKKTVGYICARNKIEALKLGRKAFERFSLGELNSWGTSWSETAAGRSLGEQRHSGVWIEIDGALWRFEK